MISTALLVPYFLRVLSPPRIQYVYVRLERTVVIKFEKNSKPYGKIFEQKKCEMSGICYRLGDGGENVIGETGE